MVYRALGVLISDTGVIISFSEFQENAGKWNFEVKQHRTFHEGAIGTLLQKFIGENDLQYQVAMITVHTDSAATVFNPAAMAVAMGLPLIADLNSLDKELGGNGEFYKSCAQKLGIDKNNIDDVNKSLCIAFMGILRWREEYNFLSSLTGASRNSIGGAVWLGQEA